MFITITSIRLKSWWRFFQLSIHGYKITGQLRQQKGFIKLKNTGFGYLHFTMSAWESEADIKKFYREGAHLAAMKRASAIATETRTLTYQAESLPGWKDAKQLLLEKGKVLKLG
jgi:heme-degrading monooxygenase HmoA